MDATSSTFSMLGRGPTEWTMIWGQQGRAGWRPAGWRGGRGDEGITGQEWSGRDHKHDQGQVGQGERGRARPAMRQVRGRAEWGRQRPEVGKEAGVVREGSWT